MSKIKPVNNIKIVNLKNLNPANNKIMKVDIRECKDVTVEVSKAVSSALGAIALAKPALFPQKDYDQTEKENYFQFKINPETVTPFVPDIFQKAAAMNLYLGKDVLVTAPTGTGKTAIAEYIMTKNFKEGAKTFYTAPLKALSNEKFRDFSKIYGENNVGLITGDTKINTGAPIMIMTTEVYRNMAAAQKFNFDNNTYRGLPDNLGTVIFDELQYLGDVDRGGIWEQSIMFTPPHTQILSLSATIGNNEEINNWIASTKNRQHISSVTPTENYKPNMNVLRNETVLINVPPQNRHVPLYFEPEHTVAEIKIPRGGSKAEKIRAKKEGARISQSIYAKPNDESFKILTSKLLQENKLPAIYFIFSKKDCRHLLKYLSTEAKILTSEDERQEIRNIIAKYKKNKIYLGERLNYDALEKGYAIHNAGLIPAQKQLIEELFQKKLIKVVLATETLSAGINMPARTTVISSPRKPASTSDGGNDKKRNLTPNEFHQMAGRAGRRGIDTEGFCIPLSCNQEQSKLYEELISSPSNNLESFLNLDFAFLVNYLESSNNKIDSLKNTLKKSLKVYSDNQDIQKAKFKELENDIQTKTDILQKENFIGNNGNLTLKGKLLKELSGYEQIPIINFIVQRIPQNLNPVQIAGLVGGLANLEYDSKSDLPQKPFEIKANQDSEFLEASGAVYKIVKSYENNARNLHKEQELRLDADSFNHLYSWAELNSTQKNFPENWSEINNGNLKYTIKDEGSLYREITMTTDLLKQLADLASVGKKLSADYKDYFSNLEEKFNQTLNLIEIKEV